MAPNKTERLKLNSWAGTDGVRREEVNENFGIIEDRFGSHEQKRVEFNPMEFKGFNYISYSSTGYNSGAKIGYVKNLGANALAIIPIRRQATATATTITETIVGNAAVTKAIQDTRAAGMKVMLKPHLDVTDGTFRGVIAPSNWNDWFASYTTYIVEQATIAQSLGVELFCLGTELRSTTIKENRAHWESLVAAVRAVYSGPLTYGALCSDPHLYETDEFWTCCLWDRSLGTPLVDYAGVDYYFPATGKDLPSETELISSWTNNADGRNIMKMLSNWQRAHGLPVLFTEVGCSRILGANKTPGRAPADYPSITRSDTEQARFAKALLEVWSTAAEWFQGLFWWAFDTDNINNYFTIEGYPAEAHFNDYFKRKEMDVANGAVMAPLTRSLPMDVKVGGMNLVEQLTERKARSQKTLPGQETYWAKLGELRIRRQFSSCETLLSYTNGDNGTSSGTPSRGLIFVRVKQQNALGSAPYIQIVLHSFTGTFSSEVKGVITRLDSSETVVELFMQNKAAYDSFIYKELQGESLYGERWEWRTHQLFPSLPAGTQVSAEYTDGRLKSLTADSAKVAGYDVLHKGMWQTNTFIKANANAATTLPANTFMKVSFGSIAHDITNEWSAFDSEFTVASPGVFMVSVIVRLLSQATGTVSALRVVVNGVPYAKLYSATSAASGQLVMHGTIPVRLFSAGDKLYVEAYNTTGADVDTTDTTITITRIGG